MSDLSDSLNLGTNCGDDKFSDNFTGLLIVLKVRTSSEIPRKFPRWPTLGGQKSMSKEERIVSLLWEFYHLEPACQLLSFKNCLKISFSALMKRVSYDPAQLWRVACSSDRW